MNGRKGKSGQIAIFLVLILAGLVLLFALNVDIFTSARSKIRLQNAADASALALARWQGATLNLIGDLNLAHLAAVCQSNQNAIAGIVALQQRLAFMGPTVGFKAANDLAKENRVAISPDMTRVTRFVSEFMEDGYRRMLEVVLRDGIRVGVDNVALVRAGNIDPRVDPDFYAAIKAKDFRTLCLRYANGAHQLPSIPASVPGSAGRTVRDTPTASPRSPISRATAESTNGTSANRGFVRTPTFSPNGAGASTMPANGASSRRSSAFPAFRGSRRSVRNTTQAAAARRSAWRAPWP